MSAVVSRGLASASWPALGTTASIQATEAVDLPIVRNVVESELAAIDLACSRFRPDSELERVNAGAGHSVAAGPLLIEAVEVALRAARLTDGDVDPALGEALVIAGYDRDFSLLESPPSARVDSDRASAGFPERDPVVLRAHRRAGWHTIVVDVQRMTVGVGRGVRLDLGATAKALAADRCARAAHGATGAGVLVNLGGDIAVAGSAPSPGGWRVLVTDDHRGAPDAAGQIVSVTSGGLATSSITTRTWRHHGRRMHHVIDPHRGVPVDNAWRTVSVAAGTCVDANTASTAALIRGQAAPGWLARSALPARLVSREGVVETVGDWPSDPDDQPGPWAW